MRFVACDRGRLGGGVGEPEGTGEGEAVKPGLEGKPLALLSPSVDDKVDRGRGTMRFGGDAVRSMAEAARAGGGAKVVPIGILGAVWLGDTVWARTGGGGGAAGLVASAPAYNNMTLGNGSTHYC